MAYKFLLLSFVWLTVLAKPVLAKTDVVVSPPSLQLAVGQPTNVDIKLETTVSLLGADLVIKYDPTTVTVEKIEAGGFWQNPQVLINKIDTTAGKIYFSVFSYPASLGNGNLAKLTIRQNNTNGSTLALDNLSLLAGENGQKITYTTQGGVISALGQTPTVIPTNSPPSSRIPTAATSPNPTANLGVTQPPIEVSAQVASVSPTVEAGPVIVLEASPTPVTVGAKVSTGFTLQLVALFLLIFGTLLFFTFKKNF